MIARKKKAVAKKAAGKAPVRVGLAANRMSAESANDAYQRLSYDGLFGWRSKQSVPKTQRRIG